MSYLSPKPNMIYPIYPVQLKIMLSGEIRVGVDGRVYGRDQCLARLYVSVSFSVASVFMAEVVSCMLGYYSHSS